MVIIICINQQYLLFLLTHLFMTLHLLKWSKEAPLSIWEQYGVDGLPRQLSGRESTAIAGGAGSIPGSEDPLQ